MTGISMTQYGDTEGVRWRDVVERGEDAVQGRTLYDRL